MEAGGAQGAAIRISSALISDGYESETWFLYLKSPTYTDYNNTKIIFPSKPKNLSDNIKLLYTVFKELREAKPDVVVLYTHYANIIGGFIAKLVGVKVIIATHRSRIELYPKLLRLVDMLFGLFGVYTKKVFVSPTVKESFSYFPKSYFNNSDIIPNGITCIKADTSKTAIYSKYSLPENKKILVSTGRLIHYKDQKFLIDLIPDLSEEIILVLAGDGDDYSFLTNYVEENKISERIYFLGEVPPNDISNILSASDLFVFASQTESFGFSVLEAMCVGLPVICNDIPAMNYVVNNAGFIIDTKNYAKWIETIENLLADKELLDEYSKRSYSQAEEFTLNKMVEKYEKLFK